VNVRFLCPVCERPARMDPARDTSWQCPHCQHRLALPAVAAPILKEGKATFAACLMCGDHELYKKKAFPHWLGMSLLVLACAAFLLLNYLREYVWAWTFLLGSALLDGLLYLLVGDVVVCYRCGAHHPCPAAGESHHPFELVTGERHRQERIRREQFR
jgi:DNA-directed RNA polymerase subunit RPC12/RpoP